MSSPNYEITDSVPVSLPVHLACVCISDRWYKCQSSSKFHCISRETNCNKSGIGAIQSQQTLRHYTVCHRNCMVSCHPTYLLWEDASLFLFWGGSVLFLLPLLVFLLCCFFPFFSGGACLTSS